MRHLGSKYSWCTKYTWTVNIHEALIQPLIRWWHPFWPHVSFPQETNKTHDYSAGLLVSYSCGQTHLSPCLSNRVCANSPRSPLSGVLLAWTSTLVPKPHYWQERLTQQRQTGPLPTPEFRQSHPSTHLYLVLCVWTYPHFFPLASHCVFGIVSAHHVIDAFSFGPGGSVLWPLGKPTGMLFGGHHCIEVIPPTILWLLGRE